MLKYKIVYNKILIIYLLSDLKIFNSFSCCSKNNGEKLGSRDLPSLQGTIGRMAVSRTVVVLTLPSSHCIIYSLTHLTHFIERGGGTFNLLEISNPNGLHSVTFG